MKKTKTTEKMKKKTSTIPDGWLSSGEFAKAVGRGKTTVLRWADRKLVETRVTDRGDRLFRVEDAQRLNGNRPVETLPRAREHVPSIDDLDGKIAGRVFRRFAAGDSPEKIVCDTNIHPDTVEALLDRWMRFRGGVYLDAGQLKTVRRVFSWPAIANGEQMVLRLRGIANRLDCISCRTYAAQYCGPCQEALARSAFVVEAPSQRSGTPASQREEHYTEVEAARDQAFLEQALATYNQRKRPPSKQAAHGKAHAPEVVAPDIKNSAGTESDAVRSTELENEVIDTPSSDSGEPMRIPVIAIVRFGAWRSPDSRHRDRSSRRIAIGAKRRPCWGSRVGFRSSAGVRRKRLGGRRAAINLWRLAPSACGGTARQERACERRGGRGHIWRPRRSDRRGSRAIVHASTGS